MDYKKIIRSKKLRLQILDWLSFIPDEWMIRLQYKVSTGRTLSLKNPLTFNEKLQWYKLYYRNPLLKQCADKFSVREYVKSKGLGYTLNEIYGIFESFEDIDFQSLPDQFVLKITHYTGMNLFCEDKSTFDHTDAQRKINEWMKVRKIYGREWCYESIIPRILCEKYLSVNENIGEDLSDYKFFCFNGEPLFLQIDVNRKTDHKRNLYNVNWEYIDETITYQNMGDVLQKPENFDEMIEVSRILSEGFPHVRIDLYNHYGRIIFGEMTFYHGSGYEKFSSYALELEMGNDFVLPQVKDGRRRKTR